jgi:mono/diheme cytochrome c family protein
MTRSLLAALALALPLAWVIPALGQEAGTAAAGRKLALEVCASCHVVAADQARAPILKPPAPGFSEIAARPDLTEASVRRFLAETHGETRRNSAMPAFLLPGLQIDAVVAYFLSLKPK